MSLSVSPQRALASETVTITLSALDSDGVAITGASDFLIAILRANGDRYDFASPFDFSASPATPTQVLAELDATNAPGVYSFDLDLSTISNHASTADTFHIVVSETGTDLLFIPVGQIIVNPDDMIAAAYGGKLHINTAKGAATSRYGIDGTKKSPVTTIALADTLNAALGYDYYRINGNVSLNAATYQHFAFEGDGQLFGQVTLNDKIAQQCDFRGLIVTGTMGSSANATFTARDCYLTDLTDVRGFTAHDCQMDGTVAVEAVTVGLIDLHNCMDAAGGSGSLNMQLTGADTVFLRIHGYTGGITITDSDDSGNDIQIHGVGANVTLASCGDGAITIGGINEFSDDGSGATVTTKANVEPSSLNILAALLFGNSMRDTVSLDGNGFADSQRLRAFNDSSNVPSLANAGGSETTGLLGTLTGTAIADTSYPLEPSALRWVLTKA